MLTVSKGDRFSRTRGEGCVYIGILDNAGVVAHEAAQMEFGIGLIGNDDIHIGRAVVVAVVLGDEPIVDTGETAAVQVILLIHVLRGRENHFHVLAGSAHRAALHRVLGGKHTGETAAASIVRLGGG